MELNSREIAALFWLAVVFLVCVFHPKIRPSLLSVARAFFQRQIIIVIGLLVLYVVLLVWGLSSHSLWGWDQLKNTIIWSLAVGFVALFQIPGIAEKPRFFRDWIGDNLRVIILVEFLINFYTLPLLGEFFLLPFVTFVVGMIAVGERDEQYRRVVNLLNTVLALMGLGLLAYTGYMALDDFENFVSMQSLRDLYTPVLLSLLFIPFIFVMHVFMSYDTEFRTIELYIPDEKLRRFAKIRALLSFGPSITLLRRWTRNLGTQRPDDKDGIRQSIKEVKVARQREKNPEPIPASQGWSPNIAKDYLAEAGLVSGDYHRSFDEWFASTPYLELGEGLMPDNLAYYIEGDELTATRLKLVLNINNPANPADSELRFREVGQMLLNNAMPGHHLETDMSELSVSVENWRIQVTEEKWEGGIRGGYTKRLVIDIKSNDES